LAVFHFHEAVRNADQLPQPFPLQGEKCDLFSESNLFC